MLTLLQRRSTGGKVLAGFSPQDQDQAQRVLEHRFRTLRTPHGLSLGQYCFVVKESNAKLYRWQLSEKHLESG